MTSNAAGWSSRMTGTWFGCSVSSCGWTCASTGRLMSKEGSTSISSGSSGSRRPASSMRSANKLALCLRWLNTVVSRYEDAAVIAVPGEEFLLLHQTMVICAADPSLADPVLPSVTSVTLETFLTWTDLLVTNYTGVSKRHFF